MKKILWSPKRGSTPAECLPYSDGLTGVKLVEQVLTTRDDTRLPLHVMHGTLSLHWPVASWIWAAYLTQKWRRLAVLRPSWFLRLVSEIVAFILPPFLFALLGPTYCCECYSASGRRTYFNSHTLLQGWKGVFPHRMLQNPPSCIEHEVTKRKFVPDTGIRAFDKWYKIGGTLQRGSGKLLGYFEHPLTSTLIFDFLVGDFPNIVIGEHNVSSDLMAFQAASATQNVI